MAVSLILIIAGLLLLAGGGECLLRGAVGLANRAKLSPAVIGLTVVAAGTSVPELAVSVIAATQGKVDITVGNVIGSNIFNVTFILGLAALIRPLSITGNTIKLEYPVLLVVTLLCVAISGHGSIERVDGVLFVLIYILFTAYSVSLVRNQMTLTEYQQLSAETREFTGASAASLRLFTSVGLLAVGVALLTLGAHMTVSGAADLGRLFGLSEAVIGLTIVAAGTGLPEVVTSLISSFRGRDDVAIGNVIGSNLFNILGILGLNAMIEPLPIAADIATRDAWWMFGATSLLLPVLITGRRISRGEGVGLLAVYTVYIVLLLYR